MHPYIVVRNQRIVRAGVWSAAIGLLVAFLAVLTPGGPAVAAAAVAPDPWHAVAKLSRGQTPSVSCPGSDVCWATAGGELLSSTDAGASWTSRSASLLTDVDELSGVDCPTVDTCFVATYLDHYSAGVVVIGPGDVYSQRDVSGIGRIVGISCPSATRCMVTDGNLVAVTSDGGGTWRLRSANVPVGTLAISCAPTSSNCWAVGSSGGSALISRTSNFGDSWTAQTPPNAVTALFGVDCTSSTSCHSVGYYASGPAAVVTTNGGTSWTRQSVGVSTGRLGSVSCPTSSVCTAFGADGGYPLAVRTENGGTAWQQQSLPGGSGGAPAVSCQSVTSCAAVSRGGVAFSSANSGQAWQPAAVPTSLLTLSVLECPVQDVCIATTRDTATRPVALTTEDGGVTWVRHPLPAGTGFGSALSCVSRNVCEAWAYATVPNTSRLAGQALRTTDGGVTWKLHTGSDVSGLGPADLSCYDGQHCLAVGSTTNGAPAARSTADGGRTWTPAALPAGATNLDAVACRWSTSSCVVVGRTGSSGSVVNHAWTTTDLGATYQDAVLPAAANGYRSVDCMGSTCVAVGNDADFRGVIAHSDTYGASWSPAAVPGAASHLTKVVCGRPIGCLASGTDASADHSGGYLYASLSSGATWHVAQTAVAEDGMPSAIACVRHTLTCFAADYGHLGSPRVLTGTLV